MSQPTLEEFQSEALAFLEANAPRKEAEKKFVWGEGSDKVAMFEEKERDKEQIDVDRACASALRQPVTRRTSALSPTMPSHVDNRSMSFLTHHS